MFMIEGNTITLSRGDTGIVTIGVSGYTFGSNDRAIFSISGNSGQVAVRQELPIENNLVTVEFTNDDTDDWKPGDYEWDIRYVVNPIYDGSGDSRQIIDGDEVITPNLPMKLKLLPTVGQI